MSKTALLMTFALKTNIVDSLVRSDDAQTELVDFSSLYLLTDIWAPWGASSNWMQWQAFAHTDINTGLTTSHIPGCTRQLAFRTPLSP
jgi:hypothetical protein